MSTTAFPGSFGIDREQKRPAAGAARPAEPAQKAVRRRGSPAQGHALEALGHAIEYLIDSHPFLPFAEDAAEQTAVRDAIQLLIQSSRAVFADCPEVVSIRERIKRHFLRRQLGAGRLPN